MATRANLESTLVGRTGPWLTNVGMAVTTVGANASLNDAIGWAVQAAGGTVADPALVTDADVATVTNYYKLADLAEYRTLLSIQSNFKAVDKKAGPVELKASQFMDFVKDRIAALKQSIAIDYGIGVSSFDACTSASVAHVVVW